MSSAASALDTPELTSKFAHGRRLLLRSLAVVYLIAFVSLATQLKGLSGANGIRPVREYLPAMYEQLGARAYFQVPTLLWFDQSDEFMLSLCYAGIGAALLAGCGFLPPVMYLLLWVLYLSFCSACTPFLNFQWDTLLLEAGLLAILLAPWVRRYTHERALEPSPAVLWLFRLLIFKLMFLSGVVKLLSKDPVWWDLTALSYHYETQCIPHRIAWYAHQLPMWCHQLSTTAMFFIELVVPFLIFVGRRCRIIAGASFILLQLTIIATGNYTFFNWLTIALCVLLFDDMTLRRILPGRLFPADEESVETRLVLKRLHLAIAVLITTISLMQSLHRIGPGSPLARATRPFARWVQPFRSINSYGLFANMTTERPEIIIEGSNDGRTWRAYEFKWKPGDLSRAPGFVAPHQPRLDWQMWFAALGSARRNTWFVSFVERLLQGSDEVTALLAHNPFPDDPPQMIRALRYDYQFTSWAERQSNGQWWRRALTDQYLPAVGIK